MEKLFSYGTLQLKQVQIDTFGRLLTGKRDILRRYQIKTLTITDPEVIKSSGTNLHPILEYTGNNNDMVTGTVFDITEEELLQADQYEVDDYERQLLRFESGISAYVYLKKVQD